jgi:hypothetical protein
MTDFTDDERDDHKTERVYPKWRAPLLSPRHRDALRQAVAMAESCYGGITGDPQAEMEYQKMYRRMREALLKLGLRPIGKPVEDR